jgi:hypothetical protein
MNAPRLTTAGIQIHLISGAPPLSPWVDKIVDTFEKSLALPQRGLYAAST